ncbi:MAG: PIG-L family deacetylase [Deltaproteobacteria bacterium]|nr:PIG-L family deacetylase [Deltaproteobacteria bacterium]MBW2105155.1 PIG-L family deacetylase [Deltaproteobacteria bacterium]MBW2331892.1 PIG-L family deacetylase [Deltaproteobacteria bacterium]MCD6265904.1 PIG-L family deacetylase [Deltaproteobacteria bacterium]
MNILAIGPHPDDIEIGCAGTLIKYAQRGHDVFLLLITKGEMGGEAEARYREQIKAAEIIGAKDIFWGGFKDTELLDEGNKIIHIIEDYIKKIQPDFIFVNFVDDTHQDHRTVNRSVLSAARYVRNVMFYEVPTTTNFTPNVFVDIGSVLDMKIEALKAHGSQVMKTNIQGLSIIDIARSSAQFRGVQGRVSLAEGFVSERLFINID